MFVFKNLPTFNFENGDHQQEKALNKSKRFVINQKLFLLAKMKDLLKYTISVDQKILPFESVSALPLMAIMVSKKICMKEYRSNQKKIRCHWRE